MTSVPGLARLRTLRDLAAALAEAGTEDAVCTTAARLIHTNPDVPFVAIYVGDPEAQPRLAAQTGTEDGHAAPARIALIDRILDRPIGAIVLGISARQPFDADYRGWFELMAGQVSASITSIRALEREKRFRQVTEALQDAEHRRDEFLAMLAHELRNPLAPIRSAAEVLRMGQAPAAQWAREVIERQTQHLTRLVDDLLDVSRITRGMVTIRREPVEVATLVQRSIETSRPMLDARHQQLSVSVPVRSIRVEGDPTRLVQVIANLLNNAAKYTEETGHIWVDLRDEGDMVAISVRDDGIGLSAELLPQVFDLFTQATRLLDRSQGGLGIGLTLVRRLVELHGGTVDARSDGPGRGSEFIVRLPVFDRDAARVENQAPSGVRNPFARRLRVLVVEDHRDSADMMAYLIKVAGHQVDTAEDGQSALRAALASPPDVVVCDIGLPGMNGYELAMQIRKQPVLRNVRLIAVSGYGRDEDRRRAKDAGFDVHVTKPVDPAVLHSLLQAD